MFILTVATDKITNYKICANPGCKERFYREAQTDYTWSRKKYCSYACNGEHYRQKLSFKESKQGLVKRITHLEQKVKKLEKELNKNELYVIRSNKK